MIGVDPYVFQHPSSEKKYFGIISPRKFNDGQLKNFILNVL
jgi:hypothetical protein